jgi:hypothetical protein
LFDLKSGELTHQDIGQMDMYVRMMDELKLCTQKDASVVRYSVLHENEQVFASRYKLVLPQKRNCGQNSTDADCRVVIGTSRA